MDTFIIAEIGVNHNGHMGTAKKLIDEAAAAKVNAVKTQSFIAENIVTAYAPKATYQKQAVADGDDTQLAMLKKLELTGEMYAELASYARSKGLLFFSTPFDLDSIDALVALNNLIYKIPSGEITNLPYLMKIGRLKKKVILSTGMATLAEVQAAVKILQANGTADLTVLHCNTQYPTPFEDANLNAIVTLKRELNLPVGYSDHTTGIEAAVAAVALGAVVIEKHFTLDKNMAGPDHRASLEPDELKAMVAAIRNIESALGTGRKAPTPSEAPNKEIARKSIVAAKDIKKGEAFTAENLTTKRPGNGISPMRWFEVLGQKARRDFKYDELIEL